LSKKIDSLCIAGAGNMGNQLALLGALSGFDTWCTDVSQDQLDNAAAFVEGYLPERVLKGRLSQAEADKARALLHFTLSPKEAAAAADFVIEAATEDLALKQALFAELDKLCPPHAILATNSSLIPSSSVAHATSRPEKVCNMHFFNPALAMRVVEVVQGPHTSQETIETTLDLTRALGRTPVLLEKETYGFIVNRLLIAFLNEAFALVTEGVTTPYAIDTAMEGAVGHPMGPFRMLDLVGIDLHCEHMRHRFEETGDSADLPPQFLLDLVKAGKCGRKTGSGFYDYSDGQPAA
jgi:3-hydroxybutyryl-CoA dehydrogenase